MEIRVLNSGKSRSVFALLAAALAYALLFVAAPASAHDFQCNNLFTAKIKIVVAGKAYQISNGPLPLEAHEDIQTYGARQLVDRRFVGQIKDLETNDSLSIVIGGDSQSEIRNGKRVQTDDGILEADIYHHDQLENGHSGQAETNSGQFIATLVVDQARLVNGKILDPNRLYDSGKRFHEVLIGTQVTETYRSQIEQANEGHGNANLGASTPATITVTIKYVATSTTQLELPSFQRSDLSRWKVLSATMTLN